jgi:hypothetical protein
MMKSTPVRCSRARMFRPSRPAPRLGPRLFLLLPHAPGQLVPDQVLRTLQQVMLRVRDGEPGDALELGHGVVACGLQLLLELPDVDLTIRQALFAPRQLGRLLLELALRQADPFIDLRRLRAPAPNLVLDLGAERDGELARLDVGLATDGLGLALGDVDARAAPDQQDGGSHAGPEGETDERRKPSEHAVLPPEGEGGVPRRLVCPRGCSHPALGPRPRSGLGASDQDLAGGSSRTPVGWMVERGRITVSRRFGKARACRQNVEWKHYGS